MPCFRGIEVSITAVSDRETCKLPEFPHPDASSVNLCSPSPSQPGGSHFLGHRQTGSGSPVFSDRDSTLLHKTNPRISVYIPSKPDAKFFFTYTINKVPEGQNYLFFKVYMNGRHIVSWGIDLRKVSSGSTFRALYEPSEHFQQRDNGVLLKAAGIEARHFRFVSGPLNQSVAADGGLIEFQVFRAKGRNGRAAQLDQCRNQEMYGIAFLSDGLVDKPEETTYYDYLLTDPKDAPYASFRFHYRTWNNLRQLHLIPGDDHNISPISSPSSIDSAGSDPVEQPPRNERQHEQFSFDFGSLDKTVFDRSGRDETADGTKRRGHNGSGMYFLESPPDLLPHPRPARRVPQPSKAVRDGLLDSYLQRPLPDLPKDDGADMASPARHSRHSSTTSKTSITPSLLTYLDGDSFANERVEFGIAKPVEVVLQHDASRRPSQWDKVQSRSTKASGPRQDGYSASNCSSSPFSADEYNESLTLSPRRYRTANRTDTFSPLRHAQYSHENGTVSPRARRILDDEIDLTRRSDGFTPSEGEWMKGTNGTPAQMPQHVPGSQSSSHVSPPTYRRSAGSPFSHRKSPRRLQTPDAAPPRMADWVARRARETSNERDGNWI